VLLTSKDDFTQLTADPFATHSHEPHGLTVRNVVRTAQPDGVCRPRSWHHQWALNALQLLRAAVIVVLDLAPPGCGLRNCTLAKMKVVGAASLSLLVLD
jgi:hypothetical protein